MATRHARRRRRPIARRSQTPPPPEAPTVASPTRSAGGLRLLEPPHSHIVCRQCGRISSMDLDPAQRELLVALAAEPPEGWRVDGIAFSLTGACARCREGPRA